MEAVEIRRLRARLESVKHIRAQLIVEKVLLGDMGGSVAHIYATVTECCSKLERASDQLMMMIVELEVKS